MLPNPISDPDTRAGRWLLMLTLAVGAAYRLFVGFTDDGIFWPDEIYQSLEPAHRAAFGYGLIPWEFVEGARNWAFPGFLAVLMKFSGDHYFDTVRVVMVAISVGTAAACYGFARSQGAAPLSAAAGAACFSLGALPLYFGHRAMSEVACALPVTVGAWWCLHPHPTRLRIYGGASCLGLAVLLRLQCAVFAAVAVAVLLARKKWRAAFEASVVLLIWAALLGALDRLTWGHWFHSVFKYIDFNWTKSGADAWGTHHWAHLLKHFFTSMPWVATIMVVGCLVCLVWARGLVAMVFAFWALHSVVSHKEIRFIFPALPLMAAAAGIALQRMPRGVAYAVVAIAGISAVSAQKLTFGDLGAYLDRPRASAWDDFGSYNRLVKIAGKQQDVCGVYIEGAHLAWVGGSTYLHREVPLYMSGMRVPEGVVNYVVSPRQIGTPIASDGAIHLSRLPTASCIQDTGYNWRLP